MGMQFVGDRRILLVLTQLVASLSRERRNCQAGASTSTVLNGLLGGLFAGGLATLVAWIVDGAFSGVVALSSRVSGDELPSRWGVAVLCVLYGTVDGGLFLVLELYGARPACGAADSARSVRGCHRVGCGTDCCVAARWSGSWRDFVAYWDSALAARLPRRVRSRVCGLDPVHVDHARGCEWVAERE